MIGTARAAGSVVVVATISTASAATADAVVVVLNGFASDVAAATTALGVNAQKRRLAAGSAARRVGSRGAPSVQRCQRGLEFIQHV